MKKTKWTTQEVREQMFEELHTMRYILSHSRHQATGYGAAPNTTTSPAVQAPTKSIEQNSRVRVLRYDA